MFNNNNNKIYHRNRETIDTSDTCIHDRSLYWSGTCTLIIIIIKYIIETEKQSIPLTHVYMTAHCTGLVHAVQWTVMYTCVRGIDCFSVSISFIIIIINVHVPDQYSEVWYMYINNNNNKRYHRKREKIDTSDTCIHDRSLYCDCFCFYDIFYYYYYY
jgi:hypothetical protein